MVLPGHTGIVTKLFRKKLFTLIVVLLIGWKYDNFLHVKGTF